MLSQLLASFGSLWLQDENDRLYFFLPERLDRVSRAPSWME